MAKRRIAKYLQAEEAKKPPLLRRIPADISQVAPNNSWAGPRLFYEDTPFTCRDCGKQEVWTAEQQKWWFEVAKGSIYSSAIRCRSCRKAQRQKDGRELRDDEP